MSDINIKMLCAGMGDSIILSYKTSDKRQINILIDGGNHFKTYTDHLKKEVESISGAKQMLNLLIITHIDQDHIKGIIYLCRDIKNPNWKVNENVVKRYWFNSPQTKKINHTVNEHFDISVAEMQELEKYLHSQPDSKWDASERIYYPLVIDLFGAKINVLSPTEAILAQFDNDFSSLDVGTVTDDYDFSLKELIKLEEQRFKQGKEDLDIKFENATSIAFLFEYQTKSILYLGDAIPQIIDVAIKEILAERKLKRLTVDVVKLSHHASRKSISWQFLELVDCSTFLVSTNGNKAKLPNKATFAKILGHTHRDTKRQVSFKFNYPKFSDKLKFTDEEKITYNFTCEDSNYEHGYVMPV